MDHKHHDADFCESLYDLDGQPGTAGEALEHTRTFLAGCAPDLDRQTARDAELRS
ncbi:hypothetical protein [Streptacidiphilus sp. PAMC 29251]